MHGGISTGGGRSPWPAPGGPGAIPLRRLPGEIERPFPLKQETWVPGQGVWGLASLPPFFRLTPVDFPFSPPTIGLIGWDPVCPYWQEERHGNARAVAWQNRQAECLQGQRRPRAPQAGVAAGPLGLGRTRAAAG